MRTCAVLAVICDVGCYDVICDVGCYDTGNIQATQNATRNTL